LWGLRRDHTLDLIKTFEVAQLSLGKTPFSPSLANIGGKLAHQRLRFIEKGFGFLLW
jgi:hypothetical protein